jgi:hypothetical protein
MRGRKLSPETRAKLSLALRDRLAAYKQTPAYRKAMSAALRGNRRRAESRQKSRIQQEEPQ